MPTKRITFTQLKKEFFALSRAQQEIFIKGIYSLNKENKSFFLARLSSDTSVVKKDFIILLEKETFKRAKRFKKLRIAQINKLLKQAEKIPLSAIDMIDLYETAWKGCLFFLLHWNCAYWYESWPSRYEVSASRYLEKYCEQLKEIAEPSEREDQKEHTSKYLLQVFDNDYYFPATEEVYMKYLDKGS